MFDVKVKSSCWQQVAVFDNLVKSVRSCLYKPCLLETQTWYATNCRKPQILHMIRNQSNLYFKILQQIL